MNDKSVVNTTDLTCQRIYDPELTIVQHQITGNDVKVLVISGQEQGLMTLKLPQNNITLADLIKDLTALSSKPQIFLIKSPSHKINYIIDFNAEKDKHFDLTLSGKVSKSTTAGNNNVQVKDQGLAVTVPYQNSSITVNISWRQIILIFPWGKQLYTKLCETSFYHKH